MSCDRFAQVHAYHDGELSDAAQRVEVEAHLATCDPCAELLAELRSLSDLLAEVPLPDQANAAPMSRYYGAFHKAQGQMQRGVIRLSGWMTTAAAVVIAVTLLRTPPSQDTPGSPSALLPPPIWQQSIVMPADEQEGDHASNDDRVVLAQWMADELTSGGERE